MEMGIHKHGGMRGGGGGGGGGSVSAMMKNKSCFDNFAHTFNWHRNQVNKEFKY